MRKTSTYARKRAAKGPLHTFNGAAWLNSIALCRQYTDELIPGSDKTMTTLDIAESAMLRVRTAFDAIKNGAQGSTDHEHDHDALAHAIGVAMIRAVQIAGEDRAANPMLPILDAASDAMRRLRELYERLGRWGLDGPALLEIPEALDVYETILQASSPQQMHHATTLRMQILERQAEQKQAAEMGWGT